MNLRVIIWVKHPPRLPVLPHRPPAVPQLRRPFTVGSSVYRSLLDPVKYKLQELGELYRVRWGIEEGFKMYKAPGTRGSLQRNDQARLGYL